MFSIIQGVTGADLTLFDMAQPIESFTTLSPPLDISPATTMSSFTTATLTTSTTSGLTTATLTTSATSGLTTATSRTTTTSASTTATSKTTTTSGSTTATSKTTTTIGLITTMLGLTTVTPSPTTNTPRVTITTTTSKIMTTVPSPIPATSKIMTSSIPATSKIMTTVPSLILATSKIMTTVPSPIPATSKVTTTVSSSIPATSKVTTIVSSSIPATSKVTTTVSSLITPKPIVTMPEQHMPKMPLSNDLPQNELDFEIALISATESLIDRPLTIFEHVENIKIMACSIIGFFSIVLMCIGCYQIYLVYLGKRGKAKIDEPIYEEIPLKNLKNHMVKFNKCLTQINVLAKQNVSKATPPEVTVPKVLQNENQRKLKSLFSKKNTLKITSLKPKPLKSKDTTVKRFFQTSQPQLTNTIEVSKTAGIHKPFVSQPSFVYSSAIDATGSPTESTLQISRIVSDSENILPKLQPMNFQTFKRPISCKQRVKKCNVILSQPSPDLIEVDPNQPHYNEFSV